MSRPGPAADPNALRRSRDHQQWVRLPAHGLTAEHDVPPWPEEFSDPAIEDQVLWTRLWRTKPAAWVWLKYDLTDLVAVYTRMLRLCGDHPRASEIAELRRLTATLFLDVESLHKGKYTIDPNVDAPVNGLDAPEQPVERIKGPGTVTRLPSSRDRFGNGAEG